MLRDRREVSVCGWSFFHIFSYERRLVAAKRAVKLSWLMGGIDFEELKSRDRKKVLDMHNEKPQYFDMM